MTDEIDLLRAIVTNRDEDMPRLMYADRLDEHARGDVWVPCPACHEYAADPENPWGEPGHRPERDQASGRHESGWTNCKMCNGSVLQKPGFVLCSRGDDKAEWAAFIRVQCRIAVLDAHTEPVTEDGYDDPDGADCYICDELVDLRTAEWAAWKGGGLASIADAIKSARNPESTLQLLRHRADPDRAVSETYVDCGFVVELCWSADDFLEHADAILWHPDQTTKCPTCTARTDKHNQNMRIYGGFLCTECETHHPPGEVPRPFPATAQPIRRVRLTTAIQMWAATTTRSDDDVYFVGYDYRWRANDVAAYARDHPEVGRNWIKAMCALRWPGVTFDLGDA